MMLVHDAGNRRHVFFKSVKMVLEMSLHYLLYFKKPVFDFCHITHIRCQPNALSVGEMLWMWLSRFWSHVLSRFCPHCFGTPCTIRNILYFKKCDFKMWQFSQNKSTCLIKSWNRSKYSQKIKQTTPAR